MRLNTDELFNIHIEACTRTYLQFQHPSLQLIVESPNHDTYLIHITHLSELTQDNVKYTYCKQIWVSVK